MPSGVDPLQADQLNQRIACGAIGQLRVEARPAVTSEPRLLRVVPFHGEKVAGPAQPLEMAGLMTLSHLASPRDSTRRGGPGLVGHEDGHVDLDLAAPETFAHHPNSRCSAVPVGERIPAAAAVAGQDTPEAGQRVRLGRVGGGKEETVERVGRRVQQIGLALP